MIRGFGCVLLMLFAGAATPTTQPVMESIDASALPAEQRYPQQDFVRRWRPWELKDHKGTLLIQNLKIANATNQRAMDIALSSMDRPTPSPGEPLTYAKVVIRNCETSNVARDETGRQQNLHIDHIRITGGGNELPLLIGEGKFSRITLRRVKIDDSPAGGAQITSVVGGAVGDVVIEDSPGLKVSLIGRDGSIKRCIVKNSPGAVVSDAATAIGKSGAVILSGEEVASSELTATPALRIPTTRPAAHSAAGDVVTVSDPEGKTIHASLAGELGDDVTYVTFEAVDRFDYLLGAPGVVTGKPWKTDLKPGKR